uniref:Protein FAR1-RELATED SEQUENCE n=1 Tax=Aegilops tauschii subsp. strangulata TaxID=200361 RepID=A0A453G3F5_AEGTS
MIHHDYLKMADQARAMEVAIEEVYPQATHRRCKWHVLKKAKESLGTLYNKRSEFREEFHKLIQDMLTVEEFEKQWKELIDNHSLQKNTFLIHTYEKRQMWAKPYFAGKFCARMTSTHRSENEENRKMGSWNRTG